MTRTVFSVSGMHCSAAMMMFLLFGNTNTVEAGVLFTSRRMSSVEGFIVWPPVTIRSAPSERKRSAMPSPAHTATKPTSFSAGAISGSASASGWAGAAGAAAVSLSAREVCWLRMFSIFTVWSGP